MTQRLKRSNEKCSREWKLRAHSRHLLKDPNGQIIDKCVVKLQTKFREDPIVNEGWAAFLSRQLHVTSSRSFLVASLRSFLKRLL
ncbi:hypothetical protein HKD37_20G056281 [Glycine soja]